MMSLLKAIGRYGVFCILGLLVACTPGGGGGSSAQPQARREAPSFKLENAAKNRVELKDFKGKLILLHFWAHWCAPCLDEIPQLVEFSRQWSDGSFVTLAVSVDPTWEDALQLFKKLDLPKTWVNLLDTQSKVSETYGTFEFPETYLISPDQRILYKWVGPQKWKQPEIKELFASLLRHSGAAK